MEKELRKIIIDGKSVDYYLIRKKIKNMNMRLSEMGEIVVTIPMYLPIKKAEQFLVSKYSWVEKQLLKYRKYEGKRETTSFNDGDLIYLLGNSYSLRVIPDVENHIILNDDTIDIYIKDKHLLNEEYIRKFYEKWTKEYCYLFCERFVDDYKLKMKQYNVPDQINIEIKKFKAKWGSCTPAKKTVAFNMNLVKVPIQCLEYVVVHELAHFRYLNHSKSFYGLIEKYIPDWKQRRKLLNEKYGRVLI